MKPDTSIMKYPTSASRACIRATTLRTGRGEVISAAARRHTLSMDKPGNGTALRSKKYMSGIESGQRDFEQEERDLTTRYNEFIITSVRTQGEFHSNASVMITERNWNNIVSKWHVLL